MEGPGAREPVCPRRHPAAANHFCLEAGGGVEYRERTPHPILQATVRCFWIHEAACPSDTNQAITPDGGVELIFNFGSPYSLLTTTPPTRLPPAIIVGFQDKTLPILLQGTVKVVAARLFAWGALALLHDRADSLA